MILFHSMMNGWPTSFVVLFGLPWMASLFNCLTPHPPLPHRVSSCAPLNYTPFNILTYTLCYITYLQSVVLDNDKNNRRNGAKEVKRTNGWLLFFHTLDLIIIYLKNSTLFPNNYPIIIGIITRVVVVVMH